MRRAVPVLAATGGALALLANFHTTAAPSGVGAPADADALPTTETPPSSAPTTTLVAPDATAPLSTTTTTAPGNGTRTIVGPVVTNEWGEVEVSVTLAGTRITGVQPLRLPDDNSHSAALSRTAAPILRREALEAQSAEIDLVSGATITSQSYVESLQAALDQAGR
jgi:uncharacterized protein with FMN-binding domain